MVIKPAPEARRRGGRRRLRLGFSTWLHDHRSSDGKLYERFLRAGLELAGQERLNGSEALRLAVEQYAKAALLYDQASRHWARLLHQRETGRGRKPNERGIERAARRMGLQGTTMKDAQHRLEALAQKLPQHRDIAAEYR